jgi:D-alanyl-D-alanine carboxypeptidase
MRSGWWTGLAVAVGVVCAAIVMDAATGTTLWEQNADMALPPASTTKVLTSIIALESGRLSNSLAVSSYAASTAPSKLGLRPGQRVELRDLLYAVLLKSANDAATVVAEGIGGSETAFASRMNAKAREIGATHSNFENAHGLTAPGHVSSARDLARIFRYGLRVPGFRDILETPAAQVTVYQDRPQLMAVRSHNRLLQGWKRQVIGKTGYTRPAKRCFVGAASNGEREIVVAVLGSNDLWGDTKRLVAYGLGDEDDTIPALRTPREDVPVIEAKRPPVLQKPRTQVARAKGARTVQEGDDDEAESSRRWAVQVGPYRSRQALADARIKLQRVGFRSDAIGSSIRLGTFPSRPPANSLAAKLRRSGYRPTIVAVR